MSLLSTQPLEINLGLLFVSCRMKSLSRTSRIHQTEVFGYPSHLRDVESILVKILRSADEIVVNVAVPAPGVLGTPANKIIMHSHTNGMIEFGSCCCFTRRSFWKRVEFYK